MKGNVIPHHFLMLRFQKDSLATVGFRTYGGGVQSPKAKSPKYTYGGEGVIGLRLSPKKYQSFFAPFPKEALTYRIYLRTTKILIFAT